MPNPRLSDDLAREAVEAYENCGSKQEAADTLKLPISTFNNRLNHGMARGFGKSDFIVTGKSTLYDSQTGEPKLEWVKTSRDKEQQQIAMLAAIEALSEDIPRVEPLPPPENTQENILTCYPVGDHHFGMLAWPEETGGEAYNIERAEELLCKAMQYLVDNSPNSQTSLIAVLGDYFHYQGFKPLSESGHLLDADTRFQKMIRAGLKAVRFLVNCALQKHETVHVILELGNHDRAVMSIIMETFYMHFENEPRVTVDRSPRNCHVYKFGNNLIATHHGDKIKLEKLPLIIATDWHELWGETTHRVVHTGHVHHDNLKEFPGMHAESHGILAPKDAHAANGPWRSKQSMKAIYYHRDNGDVGRNIVRPEMLK